ncbi:MAG: AraC family transcriptional regulator [Candidatus Cohnella colombiensis]|uniref:AraC family transcriptional regulator n=1 Tax=Candidatus Cohnella colombiensis TaxID=3121368 RepID=A0AA95F2D6_9BACL|nr:MAG: AraC family transcriptional regulator [Cohnella sp.]
MTTKPTYRVASNPTYLDDSRELSVLYSGDSQTKPEHRNGPKIVDYFLLHHVISGSGQFTTAEFDGKLSAGQSFLIHPKQLFQYVADVHEPWRYRWVAFTGNYAATLVAESGFTTGIPVISTGDNRKPRDYCRAIFDTFRARSNSASLEANGQLYLLFACLQAHATNLPISPLRPDSHNEQLVNQVISFLSTQYAEPLTIEAMAESLGYNRAYLSRLFKLRTQQTPVTFLNKLRVDQGRRLLRERPELTIEQIASSVGFQDALYFSKQFRRWYAQAPTEYRASVGR